MFLKIVKNWSTILEVIEKILNSDNKVDNETSSGISSDSEIEAKVDLSLPPQVTTPSQLTALFDQFLKINQTANLHCLITSPENIHSVNWFFCYNKNRNDLDLKSESKKYDDIECNQAWAI